MRFATKTGLKLDKTEIKALHRAAEVCRGIARHEENTTIVLHAGAVVTDLTVLLMTYEGGAVDEGNPPAPESVLDLSDEESIDDDGSPL